MVNQQIATQEVQLAEEELVSVEEIRQTPSHRASKWTSAQRHVLRQMEEQLVQLDASHANKLTQIDAMIDSRVNQATEQMNELVRAATSLAENIKLLQDEKSKQRERELAIFTRERNTQLHLINAQKALLGALDKPVVDID